MDNARVDAVRGKATEHQEQAAVIDWWRYAHKQFTLAESALYAVPNGAHLAGDVRQRAMQMRRLKEEGLRPGMLDLNLDVARNGYHGLRIEMKVAPNRVSEEQRLAIINLEHQGYYAVVCWSADQAMKAICKYLGMKDGERAHA